MNRLLLIEDDPRLARSLRYNLEAEGYDIRVAREGSDGLRLAERDKYDLILLDLKLPDRDGLEVLEELRSNGSTTPVILLAASAGRRDRARGLRLGADDYLSKPFSLEELLARIRARTRTATRMSVLNGALNGGGLDTLADKALDLTGAERALVLLRNGSPRLRVVAARGRGGKDLPRDLEYSRSIAQAVYKSGKAEALLDPGKDVEWNSGSILDLALRHVMCAPLQVGGANIGALYADSRVTAAGFAKADMDLFRTLAHQCSEVVEKQRMTDSLAEASRVQQALQPRRPEGGPFLDVAGLNRPLEEAGGDYLDYIRLGPHRLDLVLGDVSGHGVAAAMVMTAARSLLRTFLPRERDPAAALHQVNRALIRDMPPGNFMSLFVAEFDTGTGGMRYASAGHNAAIILRANQDSFEELEPTGPALGFVKQARYSLSRAPALGPDDLLLLYTDGLTEAQRADGELFGMPRLKSVLADLRRRSAPEIVSGITAAVNRFSSGPADDCSLVVVKGRGPAAA